MKKKKITQVFERAEAVKKVIEKNLKKNSK